MIGKGRLLLISIGGVNANFSGSKIFFFVVFFKEMEVYKIFFLNSNKHSMTLSITSFVPEIPVMILTLTMNHIMFCKAALLSLPFTELPECSQVQTVVYLPNTFQIIGDHAGLEQGALT